MAGRPKKRGVPENRTTILESLRKGHGVRAAAGQAGMTLQTLSVWMKEDAVFEREVRAAEEEGYSGLVARLYQFSEEDPKTIQWILERKYWQEWSRRNPDAISSEQLAAAFNRLAFFLINRLPPEHHDTVELAIQDGLLSLVSAAPNEPSE